MKINFKSEHAQIEVGGPFVGIAMHNSSPLLNRISFFYPVANSIDPSTDYWHRDQFRSMCVGLKIGDGAKQWIGLEPYEYQLTPYSVVFYKKDTETIIEISYEFCKNKPAMVARIEITNNSRQPELFELCTHLEASLKTSHTYALKDKAWTEYDTTGSTIYINYDDSETGNAQIFVANAVESPRSFTTNGETIGPPLTNTHWWMNTTTALPGEIINRDSPQRPVAAFVYRRNLAPGQKMTVVQIIGSCRTGEGRDTVSYLLNNYVQDTSSYEQFVLNGAYREGQIETGDTSIDHSAHWARAILAANAHYLDGQIVPMPCPAEYNFYFTHDVLLTDLAAIHFDITRVKRDLTFIVKHADGQIIPHAYYWKDDRYATEFAGADNWNHFWFVLLSARYLRHSDDKKMLEDLYPYISKSIELVMTNKRENDLIWAYRPDWWDIGKSLGPRSYMTLLAIRALREFTYISTVLNRNVSEVSYYEDIASHMQKQLNEKLWDTDQNYLINYLEDGNKDSHVYIGSLLAAHFNLIDSDRKRALVQTASNKLLDEKLGIYNAFPMDFHLLTDFFTFSGNEAGDPFVYMNGGIWPHGNAWYTLALISADKKAEALRFMKNTMTLEGIMKSPNGQPAMYEYRNSNYRDSTTYGKVDKPQFLWAAGWYLYSLYNLLGVRENEWNISFEPFLFEGQQKSQYSLFVGGRLVTVSTVGSGPYISSIQYDDTTYPSAVIPEEKALSRKIDIALGTPNCPYVASTTSILLSSNYDRKEKTLSMDLKAFPRHRNTTDIISPWRPKSVFVNGIELKDGLNFQRDDDIYRLSISFSHQSISDTVVVHY
ncbi:MAG: hypothetical protein JSV84_07645 [Gemmatimonadota bacterium]|nr:MAG: hypothetical protein JSV84_07645 [Gemmatimonadota bacterium]